VYFSDNLAALAAWEALPGAALEALKHMDCPDLALLGWEALETADGQVTIATQTGFLHHPDATLTEAQHAVDAMVTPGANRIHVLIGLGLGYCIPPIIQKSPGHLWVLETDLRLMRFTLEHVNLVPWLTTGRLRLFTLGSKLAQALAEVVGGRNLDVLTLPGTLNKFNEDHGPEAFDALVQTLYQTEAFGRMDWNTFRKFKTLWAQRFFQNLHPHLLDALPLASWLDVLRPHWAGCPVVLCGRGPSLTGALPALRALRSQVRLMAVGGALHPLYEAGLTPDVALFLDPHNLRSQFLGLPPEYLQEIHCVYGPFAETHSWHLPAKSKTVVWPEATQPYRDWFSGVRQRQPAAEAMEVHPLVQGGASVAHLGFELALLLGATPIILAGQDLAVQNNQFYAGGKPVRLDFEKNTMYVEAPGVKWAPMWEAPLIEITGQQGQALPTTHAYALFAKQYEQRVDALKQGPAPIPTLLNASTGGAQIDGFENTSLEHWGQQAAPTLPVLTSVWDTELLEFCARHAQPHKMDIRADVAQLLEDIEEAAAAASEVAEACRGMRDATVLARGHWAARYRQSRERFTDCCDRTPLMRYWLADVLMDAPPDNLLAGPDRGEERLVAAEEAFEAAAQCLKNIPPVSVVQAFLQKTP
jgi:hypothetical protein